MAAAAMDVQVGHMSDPEELPGLAHFCEHMLFLGTGKFPEENSFQKYIQSHGGNDNAFTSSDYTDYYFDVTHGHLEGALDRFSQFFISPLFTELCTEREVNAVHSEYQGYLAQDIVADAGRLGLVHQKLGHRNGGAAAAAALPPHDLHEAVPRDPAALVEPARPERLELGAQRGVLSADRQHSEVPLVVVE